MLEINGSIASRSAIVMKVIYLDQDRAGKERKGEDKAGRKGQDRRGKRVNKSYIWTVQDRQGREEQIREGKEREVDDKSCTWIYQDRKGKDRTGCVSWCEG